MQAQRDIARARAADILCAVSAAVSVRLHPLDERLAAAIAAQAQLAREREGDPMWGDGDIDVLSTVMDILEGI